MTTLRQAAQQALEFCEFLWREAVLNDYAEAKREETELALRTALAQQPQTPCDTAEDGVCEVIDCCRNSTQEEQEPVAWQWLNTACFRKKLPANAEPGAWNPLYAHPPRHDIEKAYESTCKIINEQDKKLAELDLAVAAQREKVAHWMRSLGYATGHGDTIEDLLDHLGTQISEGLEVEVLMEREACARVCDDKAKETFSGQCQVWGDYFARVIRARSKT